MNTAANLRASGYNEANREYVDSLFSLERRMRRPLATMGEDSSDEELSEDEEGPYRLPIEEARKRHYANKQREQLTTPQKATTSQRGPAAAVSRRTQGIAPAPATTPMEGVEELGAAPRSTSKSSSTSKKKADSSVARVAPVKPISSRAPPLLPPTSPSVASSSRVEPHFRTLHVPKPPPFPQPVQSTSAALPAANPASVACSSPIKRPAPPAEDNSDSDLEILECSSHLKKAAAPPRPLPTSRKASPKKGAAPPPKKRRGKIPTITEVWKKDLKKKAKGIQDEWHTLANYIDRLREAAEASPPKSCALARFRILVVHPDLTNGQSSPNRIDAYLVERLGELAEFGANLVKPAEFVARTPSNADSEEWTTHILLPEIFPGRRIPFAKILGCVGPDPRGIAVEQLGDGVYVVKQQWAWDYKNAVRRKEELPDPKDYLLPDDPRRSPSASTSPKKNKAKAGKGKGKEKEGGYETGDSTDGDLGVEKEVEKASVSVSPFGSQDYPAGEKPPPQLTNKLAAASASSNSFEDDMEGLTDQLAYIREHGPDQVDRELDTAYSLDDRRDAEARGDPLPPEVILDERSDDNETDEEQRRTRSPSKKVLPPGWRMVKKDGGKKFLPPPCGYACDRRSTADSAAPGPNEAVARVCDQLSAINKGDQWRERGYSKAAAALRNCPYAVTSFSEAKELYGIGDRIASKIVEILQTGTHRRLLLTTNYEKIIADFSKIYGVGGAVAEGFYDRGAKSLDDLRSRPEFFDVSKAQQLGLQYYDDLLQRIPRDEVTRLYEFALVAAKQIDPKLEVHCMGSYRRGALDSGDIDLLITRDPSDGKDHTGMIVKLWDMLKKDGIIAHELASSDDWTVLDAKFNALCSLPEPSSTMRRLDILGVPWDELPACFIYFTGDDHFNRSMRLKARHLGYRLNQRGLYKDVSRGRDGLKLTEGQNMHCKTEMEIFKLLSVPWRPPEQRRCT